MQIRVGMVFKGYCGGAFGRDGYGEKRVEAFGADWIVVRKYSTGTVLFADFGAFEDLDSAVEEWLKETGYDE